MLKTKSKALCDDDTPIIDQASIDEIIDSLSVRFMPVAKAGGILNPFANLYLEKNPFNNDQWHRLKVMVSTTLYNTKLHRRGEFWSAWTCSMCHGIDHPRGLCPFNNLENDRSLSEPAVPHQAKTNKRGGRNNRGIPQGHAGRAAGRSSGRISYQIHETVPTKAPLNTLSHKYLIGKPIRHELSPISIQDILLFDI